VHRRAADAEHQDGKQSKINRLKKSTVFFTDKKLGMS
jgi:hypothetical protein